MRKLVFFVGGAGAGKTTIAKRLAAKRGMAVFDMDTMLRPAAKTIMTVAGLDPDDRDSAEYKVLCRDLGYRITMDAALENVTVGTDAIVIGPFTKEIADPDWIDRELAAAAMSREDVEVKVVLVHLTDESLYRQRIEIRGLKLDEWKLAHWDEFSRSLVRRELAWPVSSTDVLHFDNSTPMNEERFAAIERFVFGVEQ
ncbi:AAA family ATPase [Paenibacillus sp. NPDC058071]|uniref:AAA family ATPase n=1 Tax=Paenibacillus sp. NPDC058071 TaxID=3346326 RepID=UPI0036D75B1E